MTPPLPTIYRTQAGQQHLQALYQEARHALGVSLEDAWLPTRFGETHVLITGPQQAPPLVIFQGGNFLNPVNLAWFRPLFPHARVYAPDTPGHPGFSSQQRVPAQDHSLGHWAADVLDALHLDRVAVLGASYGAAIILRLAAIAPERIERAALVMPAGLVPPALLPLLTQLALPMLRYRFFPSRASLHRAVRPLFTDTAIQDLTLRTIGAVYDHLKLETGLPRAATSGELRQLRAPVLVIAAERDLLFPGRAVVLRAKVLIPHLTGAEVLPGSAHVPSSVGLAHLNDRLLHFFGDP